EFRRVLFRSQLDRAFGHSFAELNLTVFTLGLNPVISAFLIVELIALCVPRWRALRNGGPQGRGSLLLAASRLGLGLAIVQGLVTALYMERLGILEADIR